MRILLIVAVVATALLTSCQKQEGTTAGGFKYVKHVSGSGKKPVAGDSLYAQVYVLFDDSLVFSTRMDGQPMSMTLPTEAEMKDYMEKAKAQPSPNPVLEAMPFLVTGDSLSIYIPVDEKMKADPSLANVKTLSYAFSVITKAQYETDLAAMLKAKDAKAAAGKALEAGIATTATEYLTKYKAGELKDQIQTTASGLKYLLIEPGKGKQAEAGKRVEVQYYGTLMDGTKFDSSFGRGQAFPFVVGQGGVIPGWDEGIPLLKEGGKAMLFIPSKLGYGEQGNQGIPPNSELVFYVELEKVN